MGGVVGEVVLFRRCSVGEVAWCSGGGMVLGRWCNVGAVV